MAYGHFGRETIAEKLGVEESSELITAYSMLLHSIGNTEEAFPHDYAYVTRKLDAERRRRVLTLESNFDGTYVNQVLLKFIQQTYWGGRDKQIHGRSVGDLVLDVPHEDGEIRPRFAIPERMIHETMHGQIAEVAAKDLYALLGDLRLGGTSPKVLELNTGLGSFLSAMRREGINVVATVERNPELQKCARSVWEGLNLNGSTEWILGDAWDVVGRYFDSNGSSNHSNDVVAITADPPWAKYISNGGPYGFDVMEHPDGRVIVEHLLKYSPVVTMKLPGNFNVQEAYELADRLKASVRFNRYLMQIGDRKIDESMVNYVRNDVSGNTKKVYQERVIEYN